MSSVKENSNKYLKRAKSLCSLSDNACSDMNVRCKNSPGFRANERTLSNSSMKIIAVSDSEVEERAKQDSGICDKTFDGELHVLEQKIDRLSDMFMEQCRLLATMKEEIQSSRAIVEKAELEQNEIISELVKKAIGRSTVPEVCTENSPAKCLLDAIECSQGSVDSEIRDVLIGFLQSEELKERMVQATADSVKDVIGSCLSRDVSALYLPILEHSHRRLLRHVGKVIEEAFKEHYSCCLSKSVYKVSKSLQRAIERHRSLLEAAADPQKNLVNTLKCTVEELLGKELKQWRQKVLDTFSLQDQEPVRDFPEPPNLDYAPTRSPQPADPKRNIIDQLMVSVELSKLIQLGEVNSAFERALGASDLSLVMAACRGAAQNSGVFTPRCRLQQHVLLALLQQLSTDMLHDTQLKCRYLEDAIINLDATNPATRAHLPLVVGEVRKHLSRFLASYPSHAQSRRVSLIIMAADNLLK